MEYYEIIHYNTGMTPLYKRFDTLDKAQREWDRMVKDPHAGASTLRRITILEGGS